MILYYNFSKEFILKVISLVKDRAVFVSDIFDEASCFFNEKIDFDSSAIEKKWNKQMTPHLNNILDSLVALDDFVAEEIELVFKNYLQFNNLGFGKIMPMLRIAVTGKIAGPSLFLVMELLGLNKVQDRIKYALNTIA